MKWMICQIDEVKMSCLLNATRNSNYIVPTYDEEVVHKRGGRKTTKRLLYPYYIFVKDLDSFAALKMAYGKNIHLLSNKDKIDLGGIKVNVIRFHTLDEDDITRYVDRSRVEVLKSASHEVGQEIKVKSGPFAGKVAMIDSVSANKIKIKVDLFNREVTVDINKEDTEKI